jgi:hypothetical protein
VTLITEELAHELMLQPKDSRTVFYCHVGARSLDAAAYYAGHGFKNVRSITGGIDAWSSEVDESILRYEMAPDPTPGGVTIRIAALGGFARGWLSQQEHQQE